MLELDAVAKSFRSRSGVVTAVRDLTLAVPEGAFLTLLGPSGSGKTTALRCVAGLERPDRGLIEIDGTVVADPERGIQVPADRRAIGMVFQSPTVWPHMSVWQNVAFPLLSGRRRSRPSRGEVGRMVGQALERVRLEGLDRRPATDLSGGQQQRLALARALARSPRLLLLDEPLSALDAPLRVEIGVELLRVQRELGLTTVYVTHDQDEALSLSTHVAVVREGTIEQVGTPRELYERPASGSVARALGPANLMPGKVVGSDNGCAVVDTVHGRLRVGLNGASGLGAAGSPVLVMARPEHVRVERGRGEGRVLSESFVRDAVELIVENRDEQLRVRLPASDAVGQGTVVAVEFDEGRLRLVPGAAGMLADARRVAVFAAGIRAYLRSDLTDATLAARLRSDLAQRGERLLAMLDQGVYGRLSSPYRSLLDHAGVERGDVVSLIDEHGVEGALERLRHAGVHVTAEELRGRVPLIRGSLRLDVCAEDFDNPLATGGRLEGITGGTSGTPLRVGLGLGDIGEDIAYIRPWVIGAGLLDSPLVLWRSVPPARSGLRNALRSLRSGLRLESWWSPTPVGLTRGLRDGLALGVARTVVRAHRESIVRPRHAPLHDPAVVLADLARLAAGGRRPVLDATAGAAARLCRTALDNGVSLAGATIRTGGEPLTATKAELIRQVGARASCHYQAHEIGRIGVACCAPVVDDEVHLATGRIAVVEGEDGGAGARLLFTCLSPTSQRLMLNADIGDTAVLARRSCGCPLGQAGLDLHAHTIRAVAKVTAGGTSILHVELLELVERTLPARFGGGPGDYQLVEAEEEGLTRVLVVISPRAGTISEAAVVAAVLDAVGAGPAWRRMTAGVWADGAMLRVVRREPYPTAAGKLHAFHRLAS